MCIYIYIYVYRYNVYESSYYNIKVHTHMPARPGPKTSFGPDRNGRRCASGPGWAGRERRLVFLCICLYFVCMVTHFSRPWYFFHFVE